jgi:formylglycine-generating enzyme required for sulfatase activity
MRVFVVILTVAVFLAALPARADDVKMYLHLPGVSDTAAPDSESDSSINAQALHAEQPAGPSHINMAYIEGGCFVMGSPEGEGDPDEHPAHQVCLGGFYIDRYEVTQAEYEKMTKRNPSVFGKCPNCPVEYVSWDEAKEYCEKNGKRLPTEAEWEYAARAGSETRYYWGNAPDTACAWFASNAGHRTHPVGQKRPNAKGLYDMLGNVREWCADKFSDAFYRTSAVNNPLSSTGRFQVLRGGSWMDDAKKIRSGARGSEKPKARDSMIGFRCASDN